MIARHRSCRWISLVMMSAATVAAPATSQACCFSSCFAPRTAYYAPVAPACAAPACAAPACAPVPYSAAYPVAPCQTCNYVPQTAYRTVYANVPVTTYRPTVLNNGCGCPTTVMSPITTYRLQPQLVPYTAYRPVYAAVAAYAPAAPACNSCSAPAASYYPPSVAPVAAPVGCSSCGPSYGAAAVSTPATMIGTPGTIVPSLAPGNIVPSLAPGNAGPSLGPSSLAAPLPQYPNSQSAPPSNGGIPRTFQQTPSNGGNGASDGAGGDDDDQRLKPTPDTNTGSKTNLKAPQLLNPHDRMTSLPIQRTTSYQPVSGSLATPVVKQLGDGGWRASSR